MEPGNTQQETQVLPHSWFMDLFTLFLQKHSFIANPVFTGPASLSRRREAADVSNFLSATQSVSQYKQSDCWLRVGSLRLWGCLTEDDRDCIESLKTFPLPPSSATSGVWRCTCYFLFLADLKCWSGESLQLSLVEADLQSEDGEKWEGEVADLA